jgi:AcrR family transcriptional regulator
MPRPSQEDKILAAALACFAQLGYDATRVRHIAAHAGVTEGALYRHYPSKEAVAQELYRRHLNAYTARLRTIVASGGPAERRLREVIRISLESYRADPDSLSFVLLWTPTFMQGLPAQLDYPLDVIESLIREGQKDGTIRPGQPNLLAAIFLGCLLRPLMVSRLVRPGALDLLGETRHDQVIVDAAWAAIAHPPG